MKFFYWYIPAELSVGCDQPLLCQQSMGTNDESSKSASYQTYDEMPPEGPSCEKSKISQPSIVKLKCELCEKEFAHKGRLQ